MRMRLPAAELPETRLAGRRLRCARRQPGSTRRRDSAATPRSATSFATCARRHGCRARPLRGAWPLRRAPSRIWRTAPCPRSRTGARRSASCVAIARSCGSTRSRSCGACRASGSRLMPTRRRGRTVRARRVRPGGLAQGSRKKPPAGPGASPGAHNVCPQRSARSCCRRVLCRPGGASPYLSCHRAPASGRRRHGPRGHGQSRALFGTAARRAQMDRCRRSPVAQSRQIADKQPIAYAGSPVDSLGNRGLGIFAGILADERHTV